MWLFCKISAPCLVCLVLSMLVIRPAPAVDVFEQTLTRDQWPQYVNGSSVTAIPAVNKTLRQFEENGKISIVIRYPGGDPGAQWARQLYGWLVSFGVPTRYLELEPGSGAIDRLVLTIIDRS